MLTIKKVVLGLSLLTVAHVSLAAPITLNGARFTATYDDAQAGLYGQGFMSGSLDTVYFQPTAFTAFSGGNPVSTTASLQFTLVIDAGYRLSGLEFNEWGNYFLSGAGTTNVAASVQVLDTNTLAISALGLAPGAPLGQTGGSVDWALSGLLAPPSATSQILEIRLDNLLFSTPAGGIGFIQKAYSGFKVLTEAVPPATVPEPSGWALLLAGALAAGLARRRRALGHGG